MLFQARVLQKDGNQFLVPGYWCPVGYEQQNEWQDKGGWSYSTILCEAMMFGVINGCDNHQEWREFEVPDDGHVEIAHFPMRLGLAQVLLIAGPLFDEQIAQSGGAA